MSVSGGPSSAERGVAVRPSFPRVVRFYGGDVCDVFVERQLIETAQPPEEQRDRHRCKNQHDEHVRAGDITSPILTTTLSEQRVVA